MSERLSALDVSFLYLETPTTAMHVGGVARFEHIPGFDYDALVDLVAARIARVPRYRQKVRWVPGHLANPVWVDDEHFDIAYHVRRSALPRPGDDAALRTLVGRLQSRHLDRSRPLWEIYLVEGLAGPAEAGGFAIVTKTHQAMVDGISARDIGTLILDAEPAPTTGTGGNRPDRHPRPEPSGLRLVVGALADTLRRPTQAVETVRSAVTDARAVGERVLATAGGVVSAAAASLRPAPASPLNTAIGEQRRYGMAATSLDDYRRIRKAHGGTVNDVVLATVAGALRTWLLTRGEPVRPASTLRAMVPVSVRVPEQAGPPGDKVSSYFLDLPIGEPNPVLRLHQVGYAMQAHQDSGQSVGADAIIALSGFAPPTIHATAARVASGLSRRLFNVVVANVPGPQHPLYAAGARMTDCYPVLPLAKGQAVSIGVTSYDGGVYYGLNADRDAMPDVDVLAGCLEDALAELLETAR